MRVSSLFTFNSTSKNFISSPYLFFSMKKRGQLLGQPLLMIFALIVGALILAWGVYQIYKLTTTSCSVEVEGYIATLKKDVQRYYYFEVGSSNKFQVRLPCDYNYICFVNHSTPPPTDPAVRPPNYNRQFVLDRQDDNVFIYSKKEVSTFYIPYLSLPSTSNKVLCVKNYQYIILTSQGTYVEVSNA